MCVSLARVRLHVVLQGGPPSPSFQPFAPHSNDFRASVSYASHFHHQYFFYIFSYDFTAFHTLRHLTLTCPRSTFSLGVTRSIHILVSLIRFVYASPLRRLRQYVTMQFNTDNAGSINAPTLTIQLSSHTTSNVK